MPGIELLKQMGDVDCAYNLTPEQLEEKNATADALIIRSATQARCDVLHKQIKSVLHQPCSSSLTNLPP